MPRCLIRQNAAVPSSAVRRPIPTAGRRPDCFSRQYDFCQLGRVLIISGPTLVLKRQHFPRSRFTVPQQTPEQTINTPCNWQFRFGSRPKPINTRSNWQVARAGRLSESTCYLNRHAPAHAAADPAIDGHRAALSVRFPTERTGALGVVREAGERGGFQ